MDKDWENIGEGKEGERKDIGGGERKGIRRYRKKLTNHEIKSCQNECSTSDSSYDIIGSDLFDIENLELFSFTKSPFHEANSGISLASYLSVLISSSLELTNKIFDSTHHQDILCSIDNFINCLNSKLIHNSLQFNQIQPLIKILQLLQQPLYKLKSPLLQKVKKCKFSLFAYQSPNNLHKSQLSLSTASPAHPILTEHTDYLTRTLSYPSTLTKAPSPLRIKIRLIIKSLLQSHLAIQDNPAKILTIHVEQGMHRRYYYDVSLYRLCAHRVINDINSGIGIEGILDRVRGL